MNKAAGRPGQDERYAEAVGQFGGALERLARAYEPDADKRRDLIQEIHVALWRSLGRFNARCSLRTWVYRVAHNTATSKAIRPRANAPSIVAIDDDLESLADTVDGERVIDRRHALERLHELIRRLRPLDRQVMLLYLEDVDAATIAEITGLSASNVATKVHRIKQILVRRFHEGGRHGE